MCRRPYSECESPCWLVIDAYESCVRELVVSRTSRRSCESGHRRQGKTTTSRSSSSNFRLHFLCWLYQKKKLLSVKLFTSISEAEALRVAAEEEERRLVEEADC